MKKHLKHIKTHLSKSPRPLLFLLAFAVVGLVMLVVSRAAPPFISLEPENATLANGATTGSDVNASGGSYAQFGGGETSDCSTSTPNVPDGPDPWGGCWPGPSNTGIAGCPALTTHNGNMTLTSGTTVENRLINGQIVVAAASANNIVVRCVKIVYGGFWPISTQREGSYDASSILFDRVEIDCQGSDVNAAGALLFGATARRVNVHHCEDGLRYGNKVTIEDSYCHDLETGGDDPHYDCAQTGGGDDFIIRHNTFVGRDTSDIAVWPEIWGGVVVAVRNVLIERNLLIGTPGYKLYIGKDHGGTPGNANSSQNITVRENRFGPGGYGPCTVVNASPVWEGNVWNATGAPLPLSSC